MTGLVKISRNEVADKNWKVCPHLNNEDVVVWSAVTRKINIGQMDVLQSFIQCWNKDNKTSLLLGIQQKLPQYVTICSYSASHSTSTYWVLLALLSITHAENQHLAPDNDKQLGCAKWLICLLKMADTKLQYTCDWLNTQVTWTIYFST